VIFDNTVVFRVSNHYGWPPIVFRNIIGVVLFMENFIIILSPQSPIFDECFFRASIRIQEDDLIVIPETNHDPTILKELNVIEMRPVLWIVTSCASLIFHLSAPLPRDLAGGRVHDENTVFIDASND